jgi:hypothetical protein
VEHFRSAPQRRAVLAKAEEPEKFADQQRQPEASSPESKPRQPGQTTAIVTGVISIIFGVAYLALVQFLDMRSGEMLPPPPEAFLP